jgi:hypothetical protein
LLHNYFHNVAEGRLFELVLLHEVFYLKIDAVAVVYIRYMNLVCLALLSDVYLHD